MGTGGYILGGLLQGLGKGQELTYLEARDKARDALKRQDTLDAEGRAEQRDIRKDDRATAAKSDLLGVASRFKREENETEFAYKERMERIKAEEDRKTAGFKGSIDERLLGVKASLDRESDAASQELKAKLAEADRKGEFVKSEVDANGRIIAVFKDGSMMATPFTEKEKPTGDAPITERGKPVPKRGPTPKSFDPNAADAPSNPAPKGAWYQGGASAAPSTKTATTAQLKDAAKQSGKTMDEMRAWAKANGWRLTQ